MVTFLWPKTVLLYAASAWLGFGAAIIWTAQGSFLSKCSDETTISRNSGIFWAMLQMSMFFGNIFVYYQFQGKSHIDEATRTLVFSVLIGVGILGFIFLTALRPVQDNVVINASDNEQDDELANRSSSSGVVMAFKNSVNLFFTKEMLLLSLTFFYTGKINTQEINNKIAMAKALEQYRRTFSVNVFFMQLSCYGSLSLANFNG